ncbi:unnamed protein product [Dicrocoelium dendriticum]|nr:unnamed protein product [Dicrocoelium dendriticum]
MDDGALIEQKKRQIIDCVEGDCDVTLLREFSITLYGLIDNQVRRKVWPLIVGVSADILPIFDDDCLKAHPSYHQVDLDVNRLDSLLPANTTAEDKSEVKATMMRLIISVLLDNPTAHYYQGFHDICYIFLSVLGETGARAVLNRILPTRLSLFMEPSMESTVEYMQLIFALLTRLRPTLAANLEAVGLGPHFALAWIVTWFAHVLPEMDDVRRLFDLFLATDPIMLIYLSVAVRCSCFYREVGPSGSTFVTASSWTGFELAAFVDLNADRQMDVIQIAANGTDLFASVAPPSESRFKFDTSTVPNLPEPMLLFSPGFTQPIVSVAAADFNGDSVADLLLLTATSPKGPFTAHIAYGEVGSKRGLFGLPTFPVGVFTAQPLVCDLNSDSVADILGETATGLRFIMFGGPKPRIQLIPYNGPSWSTLSYSAFGDVNHDTIPDVLILVEQNGHPKIQLIIRDLSSIPGLPDMSTAPLIDLPHILSTGNELILGLFALGDFDADGKVDLLLTACTSSSCMGSSHIFLYDFASATWSPVSVTWEPFGVQPQYSWALAPSPAGVLATSALVGPTVGDIDLDGKLDIGVALTYSASSGTFTGTVPAVLLNQGRDAKSGLLKMLASLLPGAELPAGSDSVRQVSFFHHQDQGKLDLFVVTMSHRVPTISLLVQQMVNDFYFIKITILNGLCADVSSCTDRRLPYGFPVPGQSSSYETESASGSKLTSAGLLGVQSCCSALQLPSIAYGLGPFANYVEQVSVAIPPNSSKLRKLTIPALIPNSEVFVNPYPLNQPDRWTARLFLQPLYNMKVLYIAITLICVCVALVIVIGILLCLELREDRKERQREAQRFHFDAM